MTVYLSLMFIAAVLGFFDVVAIGTFGLAPLDLMVFGSLGFAFVHGVWLGRPFVIPRRFEIGVLVAILFTVAASSLLVTINGDAPMVMQAMKTSLHFLYLWGFALIMICLPITADQWVKALRVHFVVAFVIMIFAMYQLMARALDLPLAWIEISNASFMRGSEESAEVSQLALRFKNFYRATSIFPEPSALAAYGAANLAMLIVPLFRRSPSIIKQKWFLTASIIATTLAVFLSFSLTGVLLIGATIALLLLLYARRSLNRFVLVGITSLVLIGAADIVVEQVADVSVAGLFSQRIESIFSGSAAADEEGSVRGESITQRVDDYLNSIEAWQESPILGVGPGNFSNSKTGKKYNAEFPATTWGAILAELGIIGLGLFALLIIGAFFSSLYDVNRWSKQHIGEESAVEKLAPLIPFRLLLLILAAFTGNFFVTAVFWLDIAFLFSAHSSLRRSLGVEKVAELHFVKHAWRDRFISSRNN